MPRLSKFEHCCFYGGDDPYAVSKQRYTLAEAIAIAKEELRYVLDTSWDLAICDAWVRHRAGVNEDGDPCVGWWLEYSPTARSCPVWAFHRGKKPGDHGYEYVRIGEREDTDNA